MPPLLGKICNNELIFEIKLTEHNLKFGWQNYTVSKTFSIDTDNVVTMPPMMDPTEVCYNDYISRITSLTNC